MLDLLHMHAAVDATRPLYVMALLEEHSPASKEASLGRRRCRSPVHQPYHAHTDRCDHGRSPLQIFIGTGLHAALSGASPDHVGHLGVRFGAWRPLLVSYSSPERVVDAHALPGPSMAAATRTVVAARAPASCRTARARVPVEGRRSLAARAEGAR